MASSTPKRATMPQDVRPPIEGTLERQNTNPSAATAPVSAIWSPRSRVPMMTRSGATNAATAIITASTQTPANKCRRYTEAPKRWTNNQANDSITQYWPRVKAVNMTPGDCGKESDKAAMRKHAMICTELRVGTTPRFTADEHSRENTQSAPAVQTPIWTRTIKSISP